MCRLRYVLAIDSHRSYSVSLGIIACNWLLARRSRGESVESTGPGCHYPIVMSLSDRSNASSSYNDRSGMPSKQRSHLDVLNADVATVSSVLGIGENLSVILFRSYLSRLGALSRCSIVPMEGTLLVKRRHRQSNCEAFFITKATGRCPSPPLFSFKSRR